MGRNFHSVCHNPCKVTLMHLRGKESDHMQRFANDHYKHDTEIMDDYVQEQPESYRDVFDYYNPEFEARSQERQRPAHTKSPINKARSK